MKILAVLFLTATAALALAQAPVAKESTPSKGQLAELGEHLIASNDSTPIPKGVLEYFKMLEPNDDLKFYMKMKETGDTQRLIYVRQRNSSLDFILTIRVLGDGMSYYHTNDSGELLMAAFGKEKDQKRTVRVVPNDEAAHQFEEQKIFWLDWLKSEKRTTADRH